ncbi:putative harbinger transposase-derived protein [Helianthus annuus]|nr:putative harbinger transposase-derived protein [Helianthus annuus]
MICFVIHPEIFHSKMSSSENSSESSDSSSEYNEWEAQVFQEDLQLDAIMCRLLINMPGTSRRRYCDREREQGDARLMEDYFVENPKYGQATFWRRFRMRRPLFLRIVAAVTTNDIYFQQRPDATGRQGLSPLQKCTVAMRVLAYGTSADAHDEYLRMSATATRTALIKFIEGVISCFGQEYLRMPKENDLARLLHVGEERGFPGMIGSIDCMHWEWKNCPTAWAGQYAGRSGKPTIILEVVASYDLWIWHAFFGTPGTCNDINVLHRSPLFDDVLSGRAPMLVTS